MREIIAEHMIIGAGLLGLSLADHLLRRGAEQVVILEASGMAPPHKSVGDPGLVLRTGLPGYRELEDRSLLLLEEWPSYLGADPCYRRCGCIHVSLAGAAPHHGEPLDADEVHRRWPGLTLGPDQHATFGVEDGVLDAVQLASALYSQMRSRGGRILFETELQEAEHDGDGFRIRAGARSGTTRHLYLTDGPRTISHLRRLGVPCTQRIDTWHRFQLEGPEGDAFLVRFAHSADAGADPGGEELMLDGAKAGDSTPDTDIPEAILHDAGDGRLTLVCRAPPPTFHRDAPLDWRLLEEFRECTATQLPGFATARVQRGNASHQLRLDRDAPGVISAAGGRLLAAGAFGCHAVILAPALGEHLARLALGVPETD